MKWRPVVGFEGLYRVSETGIIQKLLRTNRTPAGYIVSTRRNKKGYCVVSLWDARTHKLHNVTVHRLVAAAFLGPRPPELQVNHKDGDKENNSFKNLEYITCERNIHHAMEMGLRAAPRAGSRNMSSKVTEVDVRNIRAACARGLSQKEVGKQYGLTQANVSYIVLRKTWAHVE